MTDGPRTGWCACRLLCLLLAAAPVRGQELLGPDGAPTDTIVLELASDQQSASQSFYLRLPSASESTTVGLTAVLEHGTLTFASSSVVIPAGGGRVGVRVDVSAVTRGGAHVARLDATTAAGAETIGFIMVRKATTLTLRGAGDDGIAVTHPVPEFARAFRIASSATGATSGVRLRVDDFQSDASGTSQATTTLAGAPYGGEPFEVPAHGEIPFMVSATLPASGTHRSTITLLYGEEVVEVPLVVSRTNVPPSIVVEDLDQLQLAKGLRGDPARTRVRMSVRETGGRVQVLNAPDLVRLFATEGDRRPRAPGRWVVVDSTWSGPLQPYEHRIVNADLTDLDATGQLTARIRITDAFGGVVDKDLIIWVRDHGAWAFLWILLGVTVSSALRWWFQIRRQWLVDRYQVAELANALRIVGAAVPEPAPAGATRLLRAVSGHLSYVHDMIGSPNQAKVAGQLDVVGKKLELLPRWVRAAARAEALGVRGKHQADLERLARLLENRASTLDQLTTATATMTTLQHTLDGESGLPIDELEEALKQEMSAHPAGSPLHNRLTEKLKDLQEARVQQQAGNWAVAASLVDEVHQWLARHQLNAVRGLLGSPLPRGLDSAQWTALQQTVTQAIMAAEGAADPAARIAGANAVLRSLLHVLIPALQSEVEKEAARQPSPEKEQLAKHARALEVAWLGLSDESLGPSLAIYREAAVYLKGLPAPAAKVALPGLLDINAAPVPPARREDVDVFVPKLELPSRGDVRRALRRERLVVWIGLAVIAVVIGMNLLYVNAPGWGGWDDYLVALLWGLGVHSVGGAAFGGMEGLQRKYEATANG